MDDYQRVLGIVADRLDSAGIAYMVSGSTALGFYGRPRMTRDIDIVIALESNQVAAFDFLFANDFAVDIDEIRDAITRRSMFNLVHLTTVVKIDFIVKKDADYRHVEFARRRLFAQGDSRVWVVSPEDLVLSKLVWAKASHSDFQLRDVKSIIQFQQLDDDYLSSWAEKLGVGALLDEVRIP